MGNTKAEVEYFDKYGGLPDTRDQLISFIANSYNLDLDAACRAKIFIESQPWKHLDLILPIEPRPTPRPRYSRKIHGFYVKGASENKRYIERMINQYEIICTEIEFNVVVYQPTPIHSMSHSEVLLAEMGVVKPITTADWDNLGKTFSDMLQGQLMLNDCLITKGSVSKFYSIRPRVEIGIDYKSGYDSKFNRKRIESTKAYENLQFQHKGSNTVVIFDYDIDNQ